MRSLLLTVLLLGAALYGAAPAFAQKVQRCTTMSGETVYTDKRCEDVGAMDRLPQITSGSTSGTGLYRGGCSRTLSDLVYQITAAVENKDVNRLASVYQWAGVSNEAANSILDKLEAIVDRPLVDIVPVRPQPPPIVDPDGVVIDDNSDGYYPQTAAPQRPIGLRLEQTLKNGSTPSRTVFGLHRSYNCFWISL